MSSDLRSLGTTLDLERRRPRWGRIITFVIGILLVAAAINARTADELDPPSLERVLAPDVVEPAPPLTTEAQQDAPVVEEDVVPALLGQAEGLAVFVPALDPVLVSYHEASYTEAMRIEPVGQLDGNENPTRFFDPGGDESGLPYHIQVSRGRSNGATTAVDVVLRDGDPVLSPVTGTVTEVRPYRLYGTYEDVRLELRPDDAPDRAVVLIHVQDVAVQAGDRVVAGDLLAGGARRFPFDAVVDRVTAPARYGHVHLEVKQPHG